jgi:hypothetical protein
MDAKENIISFTMIFILWGNIALHAVLTDKHTKNWKRTI